MTTASENRNLAWIATSVVALALGLMVCANAFAQSVGQQSRAAQQGGAAPRVVAATDDMRLWSFGDCDRRFPYNDTSEHKECVRVVGSAEAVEGRALRVCDVSHAADKEEAERCKSNYRGNKLKAAQDGVAVNAPAAAPQAPPSDEVMRRVKAIGTAAVEDQRAETAPAPKINAPEEVPPQPEESSWKGTLLTLALLAVGAGLGVNLRRRKQAQTA